MTSMAFDLATMVHAFDTLERVLLGTGTIWTPRSVAQTVFKDRSYYFKPMVRKLPGLTAESSTDFRILNKFLEQNGYAPKFEEFNGIGVVSLFEMLVEWSVKALPVVAMRYDQHSDVYVDYPAFMLQPQTVSVYRAERASAPLLSIATKSGDRLWLSAASQPANVLDLLRQCLVLTRSRKELDVRYAGAQVPMVDLGAEPDISWMHGYDTFSKLDGYHRISQAFQSVRVRMNKSGARAQAKTGFATDRSPDPKPRPYDLDRPFVGFFTHPGCEELPLAMFYADFDVWTAPANLD